MTAQRRSRPITFKRATRGRSQGKKPARPLLSALVTGAITVTSVLTPMAPSDTVAETVFKKTRADGTVEFSDTPGEDSKPVEVETPTTYGFPTATTPSPSSTPNNADNNSGDIYKKVSIVSPANDSTIRSNAGTLTVSGNVLPRLRQDHKVSLQSNGSTVAGPQRSLTFNLSNLNRGAHTLTMVVVDKNGKVIKSSQGVTVNILRAAVGKLAR